MRAQHTLDYDNHGCEGQAGILSSVVDAGGAVIPVGENRFYMTWFPENWEILSNRKLILTLHGVGGCAERNFEWWLPLAQKHGYAIAALQYAEADIRNVDPEEKYVFNDAHEIYTNLKAILTDLDTHCPLNDTAAVYHGFSKGSTLSFHIAMLDRSPEGIAAFSTFISDSGGAFAKPGGAVPGYLENAPQSAYWGAHFWLYCGEKDNRGRVCQDVDRMVRIILPLAGYVDAVYKFPPGGHGIFITGQDGEQSPPIAAMTKYINELER